MVGIVWIVIFIISISVLVDKSPTALLAGLGAFAAALMLIFPHSADPSDQNFIDPWSWVLFGGVLIGQIRKINPILLILLSALLGIVIYH